MMDKNFFPMYKRCDNGKVIVFGAGRIALRRVQTLLAFRLQIKVISPTFHADFASLKKQITMIEDMYHTKFLEDCLFVLACTDDFAVNKQIVEHCMEKGLDVNNAACKEDNTFYFPYIINDEKITAAIVGDGSDHKQTKAYADAVKAFLTKRKSDFEGSCSEPRE